MSSLRCALSRVLAASLLLGTAAAAGAEETSLPGAPATGPLVPAAHIVPFPAPLVDRDPERIADPAEVPQRWMASAEWSGRRYRWSLQRGALDIGLAFEPIDPGLRPLDLRSQSPAPLVPTLPTLSLGVHRVGQGGLPVASNLLERALGAPREGGYSSRVGIEWKPAQSQLNFLRDGLGVRLDGNDRMTVRLRKGVLGIYMHRKF
jgi:hypothetical protein